jgi:hypothetical protein
MDSSACVIRVPRDYNRVAHALVQRAYRDRTASPALCKSDCFDLLGLSRCSFGLFNFNQREVEVALFASSFSSWGQYWKVAVTRLITMSLSSWK